MGKGKTRVQLDMDSTTIKMLESCQTSLSAASRTETIRRALRLLDFALTSDGTLYTMATNGDTSTLVIL